MLQNLCNFLPDDFQLILADIGSAGGLHKRWRPIRNNLTAILFDPLDPSTAEKGDIHYPTAVAETKGRAELHVTKRASMSSTLLPNYRFIERFWDKPDHMSIISSIPVQTDSFDNIMAHNMISPDVLKIDVQGGEYGILAGAPKMLSDSIFLAEIEVSFFERYSGLRTFNAVLDLMQRHSFDLIDISRIKRYRYRNSFGIINPGLGMGDRAGRIAFCDAIFMLKDEILVERIVKGGTPNGPDLALKAILTCLIYGKADLAAWLFDMTREQVCAELQAPLSKYLGGLRGRHIGLRGWHKAMDYFARKL